MKKLSPLIYADERRPNIQSIPKRPGLRLREKAATITVAAFENKI